MIAPGDKIAVGLSGGKDSIALLYALSNIRDYYPHPFELVAITVDLGFPDGFDTEPLSDLCKKLDVPYHVVHTEISKAAFHDPDKISPCYLCAKLRKGALNDYAKSLGCNTIAYGHHKDDAIETFFLSLLFEGQLNCFSPVTHLSISGLKLIRPMIYLNESEVIGFSNKYELVPERIEPMKKYTLSVLLIILCAVISATFRLGSSPRDEHDLNIWKVYEMADQRMYQSQISKKTENASKA